MAMDLRGKLCAADSELTDSNDSIRESIAEVISVSYEIPMEVSNRIAFAVHPWCSSMGVREINAIVSELIVKRTVSDLDVIESAITRLFSFSEALAYVGSKDWSNFYLQQANFLIQDMEKECWSRAKSGALIPFISGYLETAAVDIGDDGERIAIAQEAVKIVREAMVRKGSDEFGELLGISSRSISVADFSSVLGVPHPLSIIDENLDQLDSRELDIVTKRICAKNIETLEQLGRRWGITRERVRQLEVKLVERIDRIAKKNISVEAVRLASAKTKIQKRDSLQGIAELLANGTKHSTVIASLLIKYSGPWRYKKGTWVYHADIEDKVNGLLRILRDASPDGYTISESEAFNLLGSLFATRIEFDKYLISVLKMARVRDFWALKNTGEYRVAAALRSLGRSADRYEVAELLGEEARLIGSQLSKISCVVRADKSRYAFSDWVDDVYDGVCGEIEQRIEEFGGAVHIDVLLSEIPAKFGVSQGSVKAYVASDLFELKDSLVRRNMSPYKSADPARIKGSIFLGEFWGQRVSLTEQNFVGYSLGVGFDIAYANGVRPDDNLVVRVAGSTMSASVIWRRSSLNRTVDVGRLSDYLAESGYKADDEIIVIPTRECVKIIRSSERDIERDIERGEADVEVIAGVSVDDVKDPLLVFLNEK